MQICGGRAPQAHSVSAKTLNGPAPQAFIVQVHLTHAANTAVPGFCPRGFMCGVNTTTIEICPSGYYCPLGTVRNGTVSGALTCGRGALASCPEGTEDASKVGLGLVFCLLAAIVYILFHYKAKADSEQSLKRKKELEHTVKFDSEKPMLKRLDKTFDIEFQNLGCVLPNGVEIMGNVTGKLMSGRCTAVMGPSGAGKTTFVTLLTGKQPRTSGTVVINGQPDELANYSKLIGYVPQEDIMIRTLTVRDILMHSARTRLPKDWDYHRVKQKVLEIISFLGMAHVAQTIVGDEETRGISGGQRKRVNIGMELVAEPSVLFLDEPTSGLDSSTSFEVCHNLRNIAEMQGLTVAAVIHSPSPATFRQFHDFMLLGKGGHVVYMGPRDQAVDYFAHIGFELPSDESPSDFFMDIVTGKVASAFNPAFVPKDLFEMWEKHTQGIDPVAGMTRMTPEAAQQAKKRYAESELPKIIEHKATSDNPVKKSLVDTWGTYIISGFLAVSREWVEFVIDVLSELGRFIKSIFFIATMTADPVRDVQPTYMQLWFLMKRAFLQVYKDAGTLLSEMILHFAAGLFISIAVQNFDFVGSQPAEVCAYAPWNIYYLCDNPMDNLAMAGMFIALGSLFAGISVGANTFGREKVVFWRDSASGMSTLPYFVAKFLIDIPRIILGASFYALAVALFFPYRQGFASLYLLILGLYFVAFAMGYWISTAFPIAKSSLLGTGFALLWALVLSGVVPSLSDVSKLPARLQWLWDISAPRWAIEGFWLKEVEIRPWIEKLSSPSNLYVTGNYFVDVKNLFCIGLVWCVVALLGLKLFNRKKMK